MPTTPDTYPRSKDDRDPAAWLSPSEAATFDHLRWSGEGASPAACHLRELASARMREHGLRARIGHAEGLEEAREALVKADADALRCWQLVTVDPRRLDNRGITNFLPEAEACARADRATMVGLTVEILRPLPDPNPLTEPLRAAIAAADMLAARVKG